MLKNIIANFIGKFWSLLSVFIFIPLYIDLLGFEAYSVISFTLIIVGVLVVLDAGLTSTLSRELAREDTSKLDKVDLLKNLETVYLIVISLLILSVCLMSEFIAENYIDSDYSVEELSLILKILGVEVGFQMLLRFYLGGLLGLEKQVLANILQIFWGILRNGVVVLLLILSPSLLLFFVWQLVATFIFVLLIKGYLAKHLIGAFSLRLTLKLERKVLKKIWKFAGGVMLIALVGAINTQMDKIVISQVLSIEALGYYTLAVSLSAVLLIIVTPISVSLLPRFTALYSLGRLEESNKLFSVVNIVTSILVFSVMSHILFFPKELIWIWTGRLNLAESVSDVLPIISVSFAFLALAIIPYNIVIANGYTKLNNILGIISLSLTVPGYWIFTSKYGAVGAAIVFCIIQTITTIVYFYFVNRKFLNIKISQLYIGNIFLPFCASVIIAGSISLIPIDLWQNRFYALVWIGLSTLFCFLISARLFIEKRYWVGANDFFLKKVKHIKTSRD